MILSVVRLLVPVSPTGALTAELEHLVAEHPLRERLHGQLMLALYRCGRQAVWITNSGDSTVSRINAAANKAVQTIRVGNLPIAIASGPSGVWVANEGDNTVNRIDPLTGKVTRTVQVGGRPHGIAVGRDAVWVANSGDGTVTRIDPVTGQPGGPVPVGSGPAAIVATPRPYR